MNASTATGTTATADDATRSDSRQLHGRRPFRRRFPLWARLKGPWEDSRPRPPAPCTSVPCWRRSAAISTRARNGARWLVRIEDLDTPRVVPGCADEMLRTLEAFGFEWDGEVLFQSTRRAAYREALATLAAAGRIFRCSCSRKDLAGVDEESHGYPGTCRARTHAKPDPPRCASACSDTAYPLRRPVPGPAAFRSRLPAATWS